MGLSVQAFLSFLLPVVSLPSYVGVWTEATNELPNSKLPDVPVSGNGVVGALLDATSTTLTIAIGSTNAWSCKASTVPGAIVPGHCGKISLGGLTVKGGVSFLNMSQTISSATLGSAWQSANGGLLITRTRIHPTLNVLATALSYYPPPSSNDPLNVNVSLWSAAASSAHAAPAPISCGCAAQQHPIACGDNAPLVFTERSGTSGNFSAATPRPYLATIAAAFVGGGGVTTSAAFSPPGGAWGVNTAVSVPPGLDSLWIVAGVGESYSATASDPSPAALSLVSNFSSAAALAALEAASDAWWLEFWSRSSVALPPPYLQTLFDGANYILGATAATAAAPADTAPPGLYGVWATSDDCDWNGDYTLGE
jgi:hypothetical protein